MRSKHHRPSQRRLAGARRLAHLHLAHGAAEFTSPSPGFRSLTDYRDSVSRVTLTQSCFLELTLRAWLKQPATSQTRRLLQNYSESSTVRASEVEI